MFKRCDLAIVNRSFWPKNQIIGEALLQLGERFSRDGKSVTIVAQGSTKLKENLALNDRGGGVDFQVCRARSDSSSTLVGRILDMLVFSVWTAWSLTSKRPKHVYISTDPPLLVPFLVFLYSKISKSSYTYHLQDIHPEATNVVSKLHPMLFSILKRLDNIVIRNSSEIIVITKTMKDYILERSSAKNKVYLLDNPTVPTVGNIQNKISGFVFSGNAGRLQRIPLLVDSIRQYKEQGGKLPFLFIGEGVYSSRIRSLADKYGDVTYMGRVDANLANSLISEYKWALLPIEDEVTKYAFPSKTSSYISCGANILSICSQYTSVAEWVSHNNYGVNVAPTLDSLVDIFFKIENGLVVGEAPVGRDSFLIESFVQSVFDILSRYQRKI